MDTWVQFVGVILALSGVEAIANVTGVMKLDPGSSRRTSKGHAHRDQSDFASGDRGCCRHGLVGCAMLSLPKSFAPALDAHKEDMLRFVGGYYAGLTAGPWFGDVFSVFVGAVFGLLLISAVNTAVVALIGVIYMMAQDGEMPPQLARLNNHGVPVIPLVDCGRDSDSRACANQAVRSAGRVVRHRCGRSHCVNLGSCTFNKRLDLHLHERLLMGITFLVLAAVEFTIAKTKQDALFFAMCVLFVGLAFRSYSHKISGSRR